jgi:hypothetical protein
LGDYPQRLNLNYVSIAQKYREGKLKKNLKESEKNLKPSMLFTVGAFEK